MTTVKDVKNGKDIEGDIIYIKEPYVVLDNLSIVLHAGTKKSIVELSDYYDDCKVSPRQHDLYLHDNTLI